MQAQRLARPSAWGRAHAHRPFHRFPSRVAPADPHQNEAQLGAHVLLSSSSAGSMDTYRATLIAYAEHLGRPRPPLSRRTSRPVLSMLQSWDRRRLDSRSCSRPSYSGATSISWGIRPARRGRCGQRHAASPHSVMADRAGVSRRVGREHSCASMPLWTCVARDGAHLDHHPRSPV